MVSSNPPWSSSRERACRAVPIVTALLLLAPIPWRGVGVGLAAQVPADTSGAEPAIGCWQGRPLPECRSFWLFEVQGNLLLAGSDRVVAFVDGRESRRPAFQNNLEWNLGHMVNVSETVAVGGHFTIGTGSSDLLTGLKARARWWLHRDYSVELGAGGFRTDLTGSLAGDATWGATVEARINIQDRGSFFLRWDGVDAPPQRVIADPDAPPPMSESGFENALYAGVAVGSDWAAIATAAGGVGYLVLLGVFLAGSD